MSRSEDGQLREFYDERYAYPDAVTGSLSMQQAQHIIKRLRRPIRSLVRRGPPLRFLDIGCGKGALTESLRQQGFEVFGIDFSAVAIEDAHSRWPACHFCQMDGFDPAFDGCFDLIIARGFSGLNTFDLVAVAEFATRHIELLSPGGLYIIGVTSNFTGNKGDGWVNWRREDLRRLSALLPATQQSLIFDYSLPLRSRLRFLHARLQGRRPQRYLYIVYHKPG